MPDIDLRALLKGNVRVLKSQAEKTEQRAHGVTLGVVTDLGDDQHLGRIKVKLPWLSNEVESAWARISVPWAGQKRGSYLLPEVDDEVLVAFRHGDLRYPYILGFLWNDEAIPPEADPSQKRRELRSKSGHVLQFDDNQGKEKLTLQSQAGHKVTMDDAKGSLKVTIADSSGNFTITIDASAKKITLNAKSGDLELKAPSGKVTVDAQNIELNSSGPLSVKAAGNLSLTGAKVAIN
jgi:uncharacterized protein involved in type VI secretion and phage assembly